MRTLCNITGFLLTVSAAWSVVDGQIMTAVLFAGSAVIFAGILARPWAA